MRRRAWIKVCLALAYGTVAAVQDGGLSSESRESAAIRTPKSFIPFPEAYRLDAEREEINLMKR